MNNSRLFTPVLVYSLRSLIFSCIPDEFWNVSMIAHSPDKWFRELIILLYQDIGWSQNLEAGVEEREEELSVDDVIYCYEISIRFFFRYVYDFLEMLDGISDIITPFYKIIPNWWWDWYNDDNLASKKNHYYFYRNGSCWDTAVPVFWNSGELMLLSESFASISC